MSGVTDRPHYQVEGMLVGFTVAGYYPGLPSTIGGTLTNRQLGIKG